MGNVQKWGISRLWATGFLILLLFSACGTRRESAAGSKSYPVTGVLISADEFDERLIIKHDAIPGYMMAMTMPFDVREWDDLPDNLYVGDSIRFELVVEPETAYIRKVTLISHSTAVQMRLDRPEPLAPGESFPDGSFTDMYGKPVKLSDFAGRVRFISFIFSRCPTPNMCPAVDRKHDILAGRYAEQLKTKDRLQFISISFDYSYDTPQVLLEHYGWRMAPQESWTILSSVGHADDVRKVTAAAGVDFWGIEENNIGHTMNSVLLDGEGRVVQVFRSSTWELEAARKAIDQLLAD